MERLTGASRPVAALATAALPVGAPLGAVVPETLGRVRAVRMPAEKPVYWLGGFGLPERELEVARYLLAGAELGEISARLSISNIRSIYRKSGARSRHGRILAALRVEKSP